MKNRKSFNILITVIIVLICVILVYPVVNMIMLAFMPYKEITQVPLPLFPSKFTLDNFKLIPDTFGYFTWNGYEISLILRYLKNTLVLLILSSSGTILSCTLCAYGFSKIKFAGRGFAFGLVLATLMIPSCVTMISLYVQYTNLGWLDTLLPVWVPTWFGGGAMHIFLVRQYMRGIPDTLSDAARIDGAGYFRIYWNIILPITKPMCIYLLIGQVGTTWGDYWTPFLYVNDRSEWPLATALISMAQQATDYSGQASLGNVGVQMAMGLLMCTVPLMTYILGQKNFIENVRLGAIKG